MPHSIELDLINKLIFMNEKCVLRIVLKNTSISLVRGSKNNKKLKKKEKKSNANHAVGVTEP